MKTIQTKRLTLRPWGKGDLEPFAEMNADPRVMKYFPSVLTKEESDQMAHRMQSKIEERGWGFWAVSIPEEADFIGFIGLNSVDKTTFPVHFAPAVEIGWRLAFEHWGKGYATEGAKAVLRYGFETLNLNEIVSFTAMQNMPSRRIMRKIGMHHDPKDDFDNPKLPKGHPLTRHVLYRLKRNGWEKRPILNFAPAKAAQRAFIHQWLKQKHIEEWMHGVGLQNTFNGLEKFFQRLSDTTYWIGYDKETPFAFLITSPEGEDAITLDLFICDINYLGKGLAVPMIREFLIRQFPNAKRVLIDPEATNARAIHVYENVGFKIIGEFIASWHPALHYQMELYMKDLVNSNFQG